MTDNESGAPTENTFDQWLEGLIDAGAETLADIQDDWEREKRLIHAQNREHEVNLDIALVPLKERIAKIEGQIAALVSLLGADATDSRARSRRLRQQQNNGGRHVETPQAP